MSTTGEAVPDSEQPSFVDRPVGADRGLVFVIGWIVLFVNPAISDTGDTPAEVVANANDDETSLVISAILALVMLIMLVWFVSGLARG